MDIELVKKIAIEIGESWRYDFDMDHKLIDFSTELVERCIAKKAISSVTSAFNQEGQTVINQTNNDGCDDVMIDIEYNIKKSKIKLGKGDSDEALYYLDIALELAGGKE